MPSSNKTPFLQLNSWLGSDKPKRQDFNEDNQKIDAALKAHVEDISIHGGGGSAGIVTGAYVGTAAVTRRIEVGAALKAVIIFPFSENPVVPDTSSFHQVRMAVATLAGGSKGVTIDGTGFILEHATDSVPPPNNYTVPKTNILGYTYGYIAFT